MPQCKFCGTDNLTWKQDDNGSGKWRLYKENGACHTGSIDCKEMQKQNRWQEANKDLIRPALKIGDIVYIKGYASQCYGIVEIVSRPKEKDEDRYIWRRGRYERIIIYRKGDRAVKVKWHYAEGSRANLKTWVQDRSLVIYDPETSPYDLVDNRFQSKSIKAREGQQ